LSDKMKREFYSSQLHQTRPVLFEHEEDSGFMYGYTDNYVRVRQKYNPELVGKISNFQLNTLSPFLFVE
ncbi:MAG: hypothetical protein ACOVP5_03090, partial [Chitinophagales bacterium]